MMSSRLRTLGASAQGDKSRSGMTSPNRSDKLSPSSKTNLGSQELGSSRTFGQKAPSISLKTVGLVATSLAGERKGSLVTSLKGQQLTAAMTESKKVLNTVSSQQEIPAPNIEGSQALPQLDISGITPSDLKNDSNGFNQLGSGVKLPTGQIPSVVNLRKLNSNTANGSTGTSAPAMNTSFSQLQKSPSKIYASGTPGPQPNKKMDSTMMQQSVNMGIVDAANVSMQYNAQAAAQKEMETSVNFEVLKQFDQKQKSSNIKTFIRVRPLNKMEVEFNENGCGNENLRFPDAKTVQVLPEKTNYNLDKVYPPDTEQEQIFEDVGKEMVNDVLQGYNGTIFAYGPTGSGKTFTMFGDVNDQKKKGIIPRVANQIFTHINSVEQDIEFTITVSMLEIYKEQLFDLLKVDRVGLKIKENPQKGGIYVQGLTTLSVDCEEEILDTINLGYSSKQTRETRMNEYSSRSHTIFTINVTQRYPNGQEKIGKLNLVDLAGSEKVGKTHASGESLEEAKKINLSLSCLGNVIHALTSNQEHIPYRDSKLTRILQESLGGNYKTSLVAAISPHSSQHEEQTSTLKFATRAKTIKNVVKMNVKLSLDQMRKLIEQLKAELEKAKAQNSRFRAVIKKLKEEFKANQLAMPLSKDGKVSEQQQVMQNTVRALEDILNASELEADEVTSNKQVDSNGKVAYSKIFYEDSELDESTMNNANSTNILTNEQATTADSKIPLSQFSGKRGSAQFKNYQNQLAQESHGRAGSIGQGQTAAGSQGAAGGQNLDYKAAYLEKVSQCRNLEKEMIELKRNQLENERKLADVHEEKHKVEVNHTQQVTKNNYNCFEIEIMQKQIQSLIDSICKSENTIGALMKEKQEISQKKIEDLLKEKLTFSEIHFSEYFKKSINFNYDNLVQKWSDVQKNMKTIGIDDQELFKSQANDFQVLDNTYGNERNAKFGKHTQPVAQKQQIDDLIRGSFMGNLDFNAVSNPYDMLEGTIEFPDQLEKFSQKHPISRDLTIILLKKQIFKQQQQQQPFDVIQLNNRNTEMFEQFVDFAASLENSSHIINQHLARTINALEWKQIIEYGKAKMKSVLNKIQSTHISNLEQVINEASQNYRTLRNRIESVELETQFVREKIDSHNESAPKKSKIIKDTESIRHLLMKPSNDGIRQSLRGSYIGFQLDIDKAQESPLMRELKETDELVQKELLPLTYDRAIEELKNRNTLIRRAYSEFKGTNAFSGMNQEFIEQVLKEKERLEGKITMLSNELKMEISKSEHYADAYKAEKSNFTMQKEQTKELEEFLVTKMKEENEHMEKTQKKISDQHEKEILKYQQSFQRVSDKFQEYIRNSLSRLSELRKSSTAIEPSKIDQMFQEMLQIKEQYGKMFNPDGNSHLNNGGESPLPHSNAYSIGFNPTSMIFKSFDHQNDDATNRSIKKFENFSSIVDEIKEQQSPTFVQSNENVKRTLNIPLTSFATPTASQASIPGGSNNNNNNALASASFANQQTPNNIPPKSTFKDQASKYGGTSTHYKQNSTGYQPASTTGLISSYSSQSSSNLKNFSKYGSYNLNTSPSYANSSSLSTSNLASNSSSTSKPKPYSTSSASVNLTPTTTTTVTPTLNVSGINKNPSQGLFSYRKQN